MRATITAPAREIPGMTASDWIKPIEIASLKVILSADLTSFFLGIMFLKDNKDNTHQDK